MSVSHSLRPLWNLLLLVAPEVEVDDDDGEERRQRDENHVQTEVRTCLKHVVAIVRCPEKIYYFVVCYMYMYGKCILFTTHSFPYFSEGFNY